MTYQTYKETLKQKGFEYKDTIGYVEIYANENLAIGIWVHPITRIRCDNCDLMTYDCSDGIEYSGKRKKRYKSLEELFKNL